MVTRIALVGASNLVSFERQPWVPCTCNPLPCKFPSHCPQVPDDVVYKTFAESGARFQHRLLAKDCKTLFHQAEYFFPKTIIIYHDVIMNSLTLPDHAPPHAKVMTPAEVLGELKLLEIQCKADFVVVLVRRKREDRVKINDGSGRNKGDQPNQFESDLDVEMNKLLKANFAFYDLGLSNASFLPNDSAHQTEVSLKMSISKLVKFYAKK